MQTIKIDGMEKALKELDKLSSMSIRDILDEGITLEQHKMRENTLCISIAFQVVATAKQDGWI